MRAPALRASLFGVRTQRRCHVLFLPACLPLHFFWREHVLLDSLRHNVELYHRPEKWQRISILGLVYFLGERVQVRAVADLFAISFGPPLFVSLPDNNTFGLDVVSYLTCVLPILKSWVSLRGSGTLTLRRPQRGVGLFCFHLVLRELLVPEARFFLHGSKISTRGRAPARSLSVHSADVHESSVNFWGVALLATEKIFFPFSLFSFSFFWGGET